MPDCIKQPSIRTAPPYPLQSALAAPIKKTASEQQNADLSIHYSGQGAPLLKHHHVADLMASLIAEADL